MPKCFREYLEGWKVGYSGLEYNPPLPPFSDEFWKGYNDGRSTFQGNETYKPITYYQDDESIAKYGVKDIKQNFEDIYPSIIEQYASDNGVELGRLDEVVDVYVPPTGKYWEDTDNIVTDQYGNRTNLKVPFVEIPPTNLHTTNEFDARNFTLYYSPNVDDGAYSKTFLNFEEEVTFPIDKATHLNFKTSKIFIESSHVALLDITMTIFLYKKDGNNQWQIIPTLNGNNILVKSKISNKIASSYKTTPYYTPYTFIRLGNDYISSGYTHRLVRTQEEGFFELWENNPSPPFIPNRRVDNLLYRVQEIEGYNNRYTFNFDDLSFLGDDILSYGEYKVKVKYEGVCLIARNSSSINSAITLNLRIGKHQFTVTPKYSFDYTTKSFFIWTKNLFFNPMDDRWSGSKDKNVLFTFQNGKLAGNKFAVCTDHSLGSNNGVFVRTDKTLATTNQEGNSINAPSHYCIELKHIINDATNTENDANLFPEIPRGNLIPAKKDLFIIEGVRYPYEPYVLSAEQKLEDKLKEELNREARYSYSITLDHIAINREGIDYNKLKAGNKIKIRNNSLAGTNNNNYAELTIKSVQITKGKDQQLDRYILNVSNLTYRRNLTRPSITDRGITTTFDRDIAILDREIGSLRDVVNENNRTTNNLTTTLGGIPRGTDIGTIFGDVNLGRQVFGSDLSLESDIGFNRMKIILNAKKINTKNKRLTTLVDEKDKSLLSFFADSKQDPISVTPKIELDGAKLILTEQQVIFDYDKTTSYQLDPQEVDLDLTDIQYIYAVCDKDTSNATLIAYNDLQNFEEDTKRKYLVGYVNPVLDEIPIIEYAYLGDKKLSSGTIKLPPIPVNSEERYKYINHRLGRKPDVQLIDESGEIRYVQVIHLSDDSMQLSWVGSIAGSIIIE